MEEQKTFTREEVIANLKEAIELQTLQTELQELRTKLVMARANEIFSMIKIDEMTKQPESKEEIEKKLE